MERIAHRARAVITGRSPAAVTTAIAVGPKRDAVGGGDRPLNDAGGIARRDRETLPVDAGRAKPNALLVIYLCHERVPRQRPDPPLLREPVALLETADLRLHPRPVIASVLERIADQRQVALCHAHPEAARRTFACPLS